MTLRWQVVKKQTWLWLRDTADWLNVLKGDIAYLFAQGVILVIIAVMSVLTRAGSTPDSAALLLELVRAVAGVIVLHAGLTMLVWTLGSRVMIALSFIPAWFCAAFATPYAAGIGLVSLLACLVMLLWSLVAVLNRHLHAEVSIDDAKHLLAVRLGEKHPVPIICSGVKIAGNDSPRQTALILDTQAHPHLTALLASPSREIPPAESAWQLMVLNHQVAYLMLTVTIQGIESFLVAMYVGQDFNLSHRLSSAVPYALANLNASRELVIYSEAAMRPEARAEKFWFFSDYDFDAVLLESWTETGLRITVPPLPSGQGFYDPGTLPLPGRSWITLYRDDPIVDNRPSTD